MNRLLSVPGNEYPVFVENLSPAPVDNLTFKARPELIPGFVIRRMMQLNAKDMPVVQDNQAPAIQVIERAGAVSPRQASNPVDEFLFMHF